jgi:hypothetical protein
VLSRARILWRRARSVPALRRILEAGDRFWWARTIRRADIVDVDLVAAQGHRGSSRSAIRRYVRGGFRTGFSLNPLIMERLVASQLSDVGRVPALYAYLVNDARRLELSVNWDSRGYCLIPGALEAVGGPLGHAWHDARSSGRVHLTGTVIPWQDFSRALTGAARRAAGDPVGALLPIASSTVFVCRIDAREDAADALRLVEDFAAHGTPVVVAMDGDNADQWVSATQLALRFNDVQVTRDGEDLLDRVGRAAPDGVMIVRGPAAEISASDLRALAAVAAEGAIASPVWLGAIDGTVVSAGVGYRGGVGFDLLSGHPAEDLQQLDDRLVVPAVRGTTRAIPPGSPSRSVTLTRAVVRAPASGGPGADRSRPDTMIDDLLAPTGFRVEGWTRGVPLLRRDRGVFTLDDGEVVPRLRWAIKIAAPPGPRGEWWGDTHFARGLAGALRRLGQEVVIDSYAARDRPTGHLDDIWLALRGPEPIHAPDHVGSILWIISHPDEIRARDVAGYDAVFAASTTWARSASERFHIPITPLQQCTDARLFRPHGVGRSGGLVFVGTARGIARPSIIEPLRAGIPVSVYGPDWSGWIPGDAIKANGIPNVELPELYEGAGAVLNDHWPAMQASGFISNRLYDVVAAGGRVVSDHVTGIDAIFDGAVRTYRDIPELLELVRGNLDDLFPSDPELIRISERVRRDHSFDARARTLLDVARRL